jgi:Restriction endonuclease
VKPSWAEYEAFAHEIVTALAPFVTVTHDDHIVGRESEARRQIDISARWTDGGDENLLIVQVKDCKRKADVNTVGEFRSVIQEIGAQKGILICSGGFSKPAGTYPRNLGLLLWSLADARSKK